MKGKEESAFNEGKPELRVQFINKHFYNYILINIIYNVNKCNVYSY